MIWILGAIYFLIGIGAMYNAIHQKDKGFILAFIFWPMLLGYILNYVADSINIRLQKEKDLDNG